jgi:hypothetical protein
MLFIPRMWFDEVERIGKQRCTPIGYALQIVGELIGFGGLLGLIVTPLCLIYRACLGEFQWSHLWLLAFPWVLGVLGLVLVVISWSMAFRKQFHYDYERQESTWIEVGERRTYTYSDWLSDNARCG